jgi:hypothetical protein
MSTTKDKLLKLIDEADRLMAEFPKEMAERKRMLEAELAALARAAERERAAMSMSDAEVGVALVGAIAAILEHAREWAAERPGLPGFTDELLTEEGMAKARADCGPQFRAAVNKLDRALAKRDAEAVVAALIELGHSGRHQEIMLRFVAAVKLGRKSIPKAGGKKRGEQMLKVKPEEVAHLKTSKKHGSVSAEARKRGVHRSTIYRANKRKKK